MRKEPEVLQRIPEELRRAVDSCWADPVDGTVWIILLPGWTAYNGRCMHLESLEVISERAKLIRETEKI